MLTADGVFSIDPVFKSGKGKGSKGDIIALFIRYVPTGLVVGEYSKNILRGIYKVANANGYMVGSKRFSESVGGIFPISKVGSFDIAGFHNKRDAEDMADVLNSMYSSSDIKRILK